MGFLSLLQQVTILLNSAVTGTSLKFPQESCIVALQVRIQVDRKVERSWCDSVQYNDYVTALALGWVR